MQVEESLPRKCPEQITASVSALLNDVMPLKYRRIGHRWLSLANGRVRRSAVGSITERHTLQIRCLDCIVQDTVAEDGVCEGRAEDVS